MIPTEEQAKALWDIYHLPEKKRIHSQRVADHALFIANTIMKNHPEIKIHLPLLLAGCLLHDIDKTISRIPGEKHPQTGVRVLRERGMDEVADLIQYHSVQYIEDSKTAPKTWEEKLLFLSDKMVKQDVIGVDERFSLWLSEGDLPGSEKAMLRRVYPLVKALEQEISLLM